MNMTSILSDSAFDPQAFPEPKIKNGTLQVIRLNGVDTLCVMKNEQWVLAINDEPIPKDAKVEVLPQGYADRFGA